MNWFTSWKHRFLILASVILSLLGIEAQATNARPIEPTLHAQACPAGDKPKTYSRVVTQTDPLSIRSQPNGRVIGTVPKGWAVVPVQTDKSGQWVKINSHFGSYDVSFASAPNFRIGWVASRFLKRLGSFCDKPENPMSLLKSTQLGQYNTPMQSSWIQIGDQLAQINDINLNE